MTRRNSASPSHPYTEGHVHPNPLVRLDLHTKKQLSLYIPQSRRKDSPRRNRSPPLHTDSPTAEIPTVNYVDATTGNGVFGDEEEDEQSEDVDDDICLVCVAKCTCGNKIEQKPVRRQSPVGASSVEPHFTRQRLKLRDSPPRPNELHDAISQDVPRRRGRPPKHSSLPPPLTLDPNDHSYSTRSRSSVIIRDGRGRGVNGTERSRLSNAKSTITMEISGIVLEDDADEEDEASDEDDSDDPDSENDLDIEEEEERAIIEEEERRLHSDSDDYADEEDDELDDEEDIFQERPDSSSESSPDEDQEFYQNDLYLDAAYVPNKLLSNGHSSRRGSDGSDILLHQNPILRALIEEQPYGDDYYDSDQDRVGWECFIDDTDVDAGDDFMHVDDESTRFGGGDTTDEEDFKALGPPAAPAPKPTKRKSRKGNNVDEDDVVEHHTTALSPPPLATWERDGDEITIIDALPSVTSPPQSPELPPQSPPTQTIDIPSLDEFFDSSLLSTNSDNASVSGASVLSGYTVTRTGTTRSRHDSIATATSFNTDNFATPFNRGRSRRKVPLGSYRRKVMLSERSETQEKSLAMKEWYTLQERRNLRQLSKSRNTELLDFSSPTRGRRREKLRTARRARRESGEEMQYIKRRRTSDVKGSGSSAAAFMERLGLDLGGDMSEEEYDDEEFEGGGRVLNGVGEPMVLDDDLELAQFIVGPPGGIDLSPLFGAVDA